MLLMGDQPKGATIPLFLKDGIPADVDLFFFALANHLAVTEEGLPVAKAGKLPLPKSVAQAVGRLAPLFDLFVDWPKRFDARLKWMIEQSPAAESTGVAGRFGRWYLLLFRRYQADAYQPLRVAAANRITVSHDGLLNARSQSVQNIATVEKQWFSIKEAATELGVSTDRIHEGIDLCLISASVNDEAIGGRQRFLSRKQIEKLKQTQYEHVSDSHARNLLSVPEAVYDLMREAGWITRSDPGDVPPVVSGYVQHLPLIALIERLRQSAIDNKDRKAVASIPLRQLNFRRTTNHQRLLDLFRAIAAGELAPVDHEEGLGIGGLMFAQDEVDQRIASWFVERGLTAQQVSNLMGAHYDAVKSWIDSGLLPASREPLEQGAPWIVELRDLVSFLQTYAALAWQARACASSSRGLTGRLDRAGVSTIGAEHAGRGGLLRISDLMTALERPSKAAS